MRPVFRELGHPAAFAYEALEHGKGPQRNFDLADVEDSARSPEEGQHVYSGQDDAHGWFVH